MSVSGLSRWCVSNLLVSGQETSLEPVDLVVDLASLGRLAVLSNGVVLVIHIRVSVLKLKLDLGCSGKVQALEALGPEPALESNVVHAQNSLGVYELPHFLQRINH